MKTLTLATFAAGFLFTITALSACPNTASAKAVDSHALSTASAGNTSTHETVKILTAAFTAARKEKRADVTVCIVGTIRRALVSRSWRKVLKGARPSIKKLNERGDFRIRSIHKNKRVAMNLRNRCES